MKSSSSHPFGSTNDVEKKRKNKKLITSAKFSKIVKKPQHSEVIKEKRNSKLSKQAVISITPISDPAVKMAANLTCSMKKSKASVKLIVAHSKQSIVKRTVPNVSISNPSPLMESVSPDLVKKISTKKNSVNVSKDKTKKHPDSGSKNVREAKLKLEKLHKTVVSSKIKKKSGRKLIVKAPVVRNKVSWNDSNVTQSLVNGAGFGNVNFKKKLIKTPIKTSPPTNTNPPNTSATQKMTKMNKSVSVSVRPVTCTNGTPKCKFSKVKKIAIIDADQDVRSGFPTKSSASPSKLVTVNSNLGKKKSRNTSVEFPKIKRSNKKQKVIGIKSNKGSKEKVDKCGKHKADVSEDTGEKKKKKTTNSDSVHSDIEDDDSGILYALSNEESDDSMDMSEAVDKVAPNQTEVRMEFVKKTEPKPKENVDRFGKFLSESSKKKIPLISDVIDLKTCMYPVIDLGEKVKVIPAATFKKPQSTGSSVLKMKSVKPVQHPVSPTPLFTTVKPLTSSMFRPQTITSASALMDEYCGDVPAYHYFPSVLPISPSSMSYKTLLDSLPSELHPGKSKRKENDMEEEDERVERRSSVRQSECAFRYKYIVVKKCEKYTQIWLNSQTKMKNALNPLVIQEVISAFNSAKYDDSNLVMFSGLGNVFCSGIDLNYLSSGDRRVVAREMVDALRDFTKALITFSKPVVAVVTGPAIGIGMTMLPLCDVVYASDKATFSLPYAQIAQTPEGCATYTLPLAVGMAMTNELLIGRRKITAIEACQLGLVSQVLWPTSMMQEVIPRVQNMALLSGKALETTKLLIRSHQRTKLELTNESECNLLLERWSSSDCQKAIQTYLADEKNFTL